MSSSSPGTLPQFTQITADSQRIRSAAGRTGTFPVPPRVPRQTTHLTGRFCIQDKLENLQEALEPRRLESQNEFAKFWDKVSETYRSLSSCPHHRSGLLNYPSGHSEFGTGERTSSWKCPPFKHKWTSSIWTSGTPAVCIPFVPADPSNQPVPLPPALKATHSLTCSAVRVQPTAGLSCPVLERLLGCQTSLPEADATLAPASRSNPVGSDLPAAERGCCERQRLRFPRNQSEPLPFPDLEISDGAGGGCGKWEAERLRNRCVIEFPHNTANICVNSGTSTLAATFLDKSDGDPDAEAPN